MVVLRRFLLPLAPLQRAVVRSVFRSQGGLPSSPFVSANRQKVPPRGKRADPSNRKRASGRWWWCSSYSLGSATACCSQVGLS